MFAGKAGAYPSGAPKITSPLVRLLALHTKIRLGCKGLPGTNTLAYYEHLSITDVKSFITLAPVAKIINIFGVIYAHSGIFP
jgi:hypothetical protein